MWIRMKYVVRIKSGGKEYFYYRRQGKRHGRLRGKPDSKRFLQDYHRIHAKFEGWRSGDIPNSIADICTKYLASPEYKGKAESTRTSYKSAIDRIRTVLGPFNVTELRRSHIKRFRDQHADKAGMANLMLSVLRILFDYAIDDDLLTSNPANGVKHLETGSHDPWPEHVIADVLDRAPPHIAHAVAIGLCTGQRKSDVLKMRWSDVDGGVVQVVQKKTKEKLSIPVLPDFNALLGVLPRRAVTLLSTPTGRVWTEGNFDKQFRKTMRDLGHQGWVFHGLRGNAATMLAEAGCTIHEIASVTGHKALQNVQRYTRKVDQRKLAQEAMRKLIANRSVKGVK